MYGASPQMLGAPAGSFMFLKLSLAVLLGLLGSADAQCTNTCSYASDIDCDDGGPGAEFYNMCSLGTDCDDCGPRDSTSSTPPSPPPATPPAAANTMFRVRPVGFSSSTYNTWKVDEVYFSTMGCDYSDAGRVAHDAGSVVSSLSVNANLPRDDIEVEQQIAFDGSYSQTASVTSDPAQLDDDGQQIFFVGQAFSTPMAIDCATIVTPSCRG